MEPEQASGSASSMRSRRTTSREADSIQTYFGKERGSARTYRSSSQVNNGVIVAGGSDESPGGKYSNNEASTPLDPSPRKEQHKLSRFFSKQKFHSVLNDEGDNNQRPHQQQASTVAQLAKISHIYHDLKASHRNLLVPPEIHDKIAHIGVEYGRSPVIDTLILSFVGGMFVALGAGTAFLLAGSLTQAPTNPDIDEQNYGVFKIVYSLFGYQFAFTSIVACGADLFTSICVYTAVSYIEGKINLYEVCSALVFSWLGNFAGCAFFAYLLHKTEILDGHDEYLIEATQGKLDLAWEIAFTRAIFANICVGTATWLATAALDMSGKILAIFLAIFVFAALGFEHCIANQFILSMGCMQMETSTGQTCSVKEVMIDNLLPVTIGNWIGGVFFVAIPMSMIFGENNVHLLVDKVKSKAFEWTSGQSRDQQDSDMDAESGKGNNGVEKRDGDELGGVYADGSLEDIGKEGLLLGEEQRKRENQNGIELVIRETTAHQTPANGGTQIEEVKLDP